MSDFLSELRTEVLGAHAAHRRRGAAGRRYRALRSAAPALAAAAVLLAIAWVVPGLLSSPPAGPRVLAVVRVGGNPTAAVAGGGAVWVSDFARRQVVRVDPATRRIADRIASRGQPVALATDGRGVWVRTAIGDGGEVGRVGAGTWGPVGYGATLAAGSGLVWAADVELGPERLRRIDAATGQRDGSVDVRGVYALASGRDALWAVTGNGTVLRLDPRTGRALARWPALAISSGSAPPALVADDKGAWILRTGQGAESQAIRIEGTRVVRRLPLDPSARPQLAEGRDGLWTVAEDAQHHRYTALRIDPEDGGVTARVALGTRNPTALVTTADELWIASSDGTITIVGR